jgi:hypothetical protein
VIFVMKGGRAREGTATWSMAFENFLHCRKLIDLILHIALHMLIW